MFTVHGLWPSNLVQPCMANFKVWWPKSCTVNTF